MPSPKLTVLLLPGWLDSGPAHWQSHWETTPPTAHTYTRVQQHDWQRPLRGDWQARLEEIIVNHIAQSASSQRSIVLVAHSLGNHLVAAWARASSHTGAIRGALMVAPPDVTQADLPPDLYNWRTPILDKLPFPATCVISSNDPFCQRSAGLAIATAWGARCVQAGPLGHINGDSGLGHWPQGQALLTALFD
jgi:uncharacterized protein